MTMPKPVQQSPFRALAYGSESDFQNFHPHLHVLATDGCVYNDDAFMVCPPPNTGDLEELFRHEVFKMLKAEGKIKDGTSTKTFDALDWPRREPGCKHSPNW